MRSDRLRRIAASRRLTQGLVAVAGVMVAADLAVSAVQAKRFAELGRLIGQRPAQLPRDNDLDPLAYFAPTAALVGAQQLIPARARYTIVIGSYVGMGDPALPRIALQMWLVPRLYVASPRDADWVITYHHASESIGVPYLNETEVAPGINVVQVRRP